MNKAILKKIVLIVTLLVAVVFVAIVLYVRNNTAPDIENCSSINYEQNKLKKIDAIYMRIITMQAKAGYAKEKGIIKAEGKEYIFNRSFGFDIINYDRGNYYIRINASAKSSSDNVPEILIQSLWEEKYKKNHILNVKNIGSNNYQFSGLESPIFVCKTSPR